MTDIKEIESFITKFPVYQYAFLKPDELTFSEDLRTYCKQYCSKYDTSWSCPPAIPRMEKCRQRCLQYSDALVFSTVSRIRDISNKEARLDSQKAHEQLTTLIESHLKEEGYELMTLTSDACNICQKCTFPHEYCKFPDDMHPCIESYGIVISKLAGDLCMDYDMGERLYIWFAIILFSRDMEEISNEIKPEERASDLPENFIETDVSGDTRIYNVRDNRKKDRTSF